MKILEEMGTAIHNVERIEGRIAVIALEHCADYPNIRTANSLEQLHAIEAEIVRLQMTKSRQNTVERGIIRKDSRGNPY